MGCHCFFRWDFENHGTTIDDQNDDTCVSLYDLYGCHIDTISHLYTSGYVYEKSPSLIINDSISNPHVPTVLY